MQESFERAIGGPVEPLRGAELLLRKYTPSLQRRGSGRAEAGENARPQMIPFGILRGVSMHLSALLAVLILSWDRREVLLGC